MDFFNLLIFPFILICTLYSLSFGRRVWKPQPYHFRSCMGKKWKDQFPNVPKEEIRTFLFLFADSFGFLPEEKLRFAPQDKLLDIYRALYPRERSVDELEFETLACDIEKTYSVDFTKIWNNADLTLGELFAYVNLKACW